MRAIVLQSRTRDATRELISPIYFVGIEPEKTDKLDTVSITKKI